MYNKIIKWSIYLLVFFLPIFFLPWSFEAFEFNKQYLLFSLVSFAFLAWLARMILVDKEIKFKRSPLDLFVVAFLFFSILSAVFSVDKGSSLFGFYGRFSDSLIGLLSLAALYFLITNNADIKVKSKKSLSDKQAGKVKSLNQDSKIEENDCKLLPVAGLMKTFLWSVFFVILFSYFSILGVWGRIDNMLGEKISLPPIMMQSIFNPLSGSMEGLAVFLAVIVILLTGMFLIKDDKGTDKRKSKTKGIYFLFLTAFVLLMIIDFNPAWMIISLSLIVFLAVILWKRIFKENVNRLLLPILLVVLSIFFIFTNVLDIQGVVLRYYLPQEQVLGQGTSWLVGLKSATENVKSGFVGSGIGTFHYGFAKFKPVEFNQNMLWQIRFDRPGSHFAEVLGTIGFLGLFSYLALIGMFLLASYLFLQQNKIGIPLLMVFLALLAGQFVFYQNTVLSFVFWLVLGLSVVNWQKPVKEKTISFKDFPELSLVFSVLLIVFALLFALMYFFAIRFYLADAYYMSYFKTWEGQKLERAVNFNPGQSQYKLVIARDYLNKVIIEAQKPEDEIDKEAFSNNIYLAITYVKGGLIYGNVVKGAVELSPNRVAVWETLGIIYRDIQGIAAGALDWGISSFETAINLEPTNPVLHTELGKLYLISKDSEKAREKFNKAKELMPDYVDSSIQISLLHESEKNMEEAVRQMENLAETYPLNIDVLFQLGRLYFNDNRTDDAIASFEAIIALMPNHSNALYSIGIAYEKKGDKEKAIANFEKVLELNPDNQEIIKKLESLKGITQEYQEPETETETEPEE